MDFSKTSKYQLNDNDQLEKYDLSTDKLDSANKKMAGISNKKERTLEEAKIDVGKRSAAKRDNARYDGEIGAVVQKKTDTEYKAVWDFFLKNHEREFKKAYGYGKEVIERIGFKKFVDAMDWSTEKDTSSWKTDVWHIMPCVHCDSKFTIYENHMCLCDACAPLYDVEYMEQLIANAASVDNGFSKKLYSTLTSKHNMDKFKILTTNQYFKKIGDPKGDGGINMFGLTCLRGAIKKIKQETRDKKLPGSSEKQRYLDYMKEEYSKFDVSNRPKLTEYYKAVTSVPEEGKWEYEIQGKLVDMMSKSGVTVEVDQE